MITILETGMCTCEVAPMGHGGLEGFNEKEQYLYELCSTAGVPNWYRIYHNHTDDPYRETCSVGIFKQHFKLHQNGTTNSQNQETSTVH